MNRYVPEAGMALIFFLGAIWMAPSRIAIEESFQPIAVKQQQGVADSPLNESGNNEAWRPTSVRRSLALKRRNIFDPDGTYDQPDALAKKNNTKNHKTKNGKSPASSTVENTFTLVAVLQGEAPSAVFRDASGILRLHHEGDRLTKKAKITKIGKLKVTVRNGKKENVYEIFHIPQSLKR